MHVISALNARSLILATEGQFFKTIHYEITNVNIVGFIVRRENITNVLPRLSREKRVQTRLGSDL